MWGAKAVLCVPTPASWHCPLAHSLVPLSVECNEEDMLLLQMVRTLNMHLSSITGFSATATRPQQASTVTSHLLLLARPSLASWKFMTTESHPTCPWSAFLRHWRLPYTPPPRMSLAFGWVTKTHLPLHRFFDWKHPFFLVFLSSSSFFFEAGIRHRIFIIIYQQ